MAIFADIVALARAGFTPKEVKELMAMDKQTSAEEPAENPEEAPEQPEQENAPEEDPAETEAETEPEDRTAELQKQIDDLKKQLAAAQKKNAKQNLQGQDPVKTEQEKLEEIARGFL